MTRLNPAHKKENREGNCCNVRCDEQAATRAKTFSSTVQQRHLRPTAPPPPALHILICIPVPAAPGASQNPSL